MRTRDAAVDRDGARELQLYVENDADLYRRQGLPIVKNLATKMARGVYKHEGAVKLYGYLMESGAKKYVREFGSDTAWHAMFGPATRRAAAEEFALGFEAEWNAGQYRDLLPKKYQKQLGLCRCGHPKHQAQCPTEDGCWCDTFTRGGLPAPPRRTAPPTLRRTFTPRQASLSDLRPLPRGFGEEFTDPGTVSGVGYGDSPSVTCQRCRNRGGCCHHEFHHLGETCTHCGMVNN